MAVIIVSCEGQKIKEFEFNFFLIRLLVLFIFVDLKKGLVMKHHHTALSIDCNFLECLDFRMIGLDPRRPLPTTHWGVYLSVNTMTLII